ncbi:MAG: response regulator transcription factor [Myxococcota bacterium]
MSVRVFVVDDHPIIVQGLQRYAELDDDLTIAGTASSIEGCRAAFDRSRIDVLSLDVQVTGMKGPSTVAELSATGVPILLFTLLEPDEAVAALVRAGARGYLAKSSGMDAYVRAVRALHAGDDVLPDELRRISAHPPAPDEVLTGRELELFRQLAQGDSIKEAAFTLGVSPSTAYSHYNRIRAKLDLRDLSGLVRYASTWNFEP